MDRSVFERMAAFEDDHWWFAARRREIADQTIRSFAGNSPNFHSFRTANLIIGQLRERFGFSCFATQLAA